MSSWGPSSLKPAHSVIAPLFTVGQSGFLLTDKWMKKSVCVCVVNTRVPLSCKENYRYHLKKYMEQEITLSKRRQRYKDKNAFISLEGRWRGGRGKRG